MLPGFFSTCFILGCYAGLFIRPHVKPLVFPTSLALNAASIHLLPPAVKLLAFIQSPSLALTSTPSSVRFSLPPTISPWTVQGLPPASSSPPFTWLASASPKQNVSAQQGPAIPHSPLPIFPFPLSAPPRLELPPLRHQSPPPSLPMCAPNDAPVNSSRPHIPLLCPSPYFTFTLNTLRNINSSALRSPTPSSPSPPTLVARFRTLRTLPFKPAQGGFGRAGTRPFEFITMAFAALAVAGIVTIALESGPLSSEGDGESNEPNNDKVGFEDNDEAAAADEIETNNGGGEDDPSLPPSPSSVFDDDPPELPLPGHDTHALLVLVLLYRYAAEHAIHRSEPVEAMENVEREDRAVDPTRLPSADSASPSQFLSLRDTAVESSCSATCASVSASMLISKAPQEVPTPCATSSQYDLALMNPLPDDKDDLWVEDLAIPRANTSDDNLALSIPLPDDDEGLWIGVSADERAGWDESEMPIVVEDTAPVEKREEVPVEHASGFVIRREKGGCATFVDLPSTLTTKFQPSCGSARDRVDPLTPTSSSTSTSVPLTAKTVAPACKTVHKCQAGIETNLTPAPKKKAVLAPLGVKLDGLGYWVARLGSTVEARSQVVAQPAQELVSAIKQEKPERAVKKFVRWTDTPKSAFGATTQPSAPGSVTILKQERSVGAKPARASSAKDAAFVASADRLMETLKAERDKLAAEVEKDKAMKESHGRAFERAMSAIREAQAMNGVESGRSVQSSASSHRAPHLPIPAIIRKPMTILRRPSPPAPPCDENGATAAGPSTTSCGDEAKHDGNETIASATPPTPPQPTSTDNENDDAAAAGPSNVSGGGNATLSKQQMLNRRRRQRKYVLMTVELFAQLPGDDVCLPDTPAKAETEEEKHGAPVFNAEVVEKKEDSPDTIVLVRNPKRRNSITSGTRIGPSTCPAGELETGDPEEVDATAEERGRCPTA